MKTYTICGSMRFSEEMMQISFMLESQKGFNVLQCVYNTNKDSLSSNEFENLSKAHLRKIDISDGIYVVNINGYIGESVSKEIEYAHSKGKEIIYHCKYP